jgi:2-dehydro-3-deoxyphosphogluconate aldolase/(4S)-4-hydroxy-2-oxoglutarate aldolase
MSKKILVTQSITHQGLLPLYFNKDFTISIEILRALYKAGIRSVEYTNRGPAAFENFKDMIRVRNAEMPDLFLGVGTIKNMPDAGKYMDAGADFLVSPGFVSDVAQFAAVNQFFYAPGCMTPSEIIAAELAGIGFIKLFPGNLLGPEFLSSIKEIFPGLLFMPTGGVDATPESIQAWFKAGVCAVGMGSKLISKSFMEQKNYEAITDLTFKVLTMVNAARQVKV